MIAPLSAPMAGSWNNVSLGTRAPGRPMAMRERENMVLQAAISRDPGYFTSLAVSTGYPYNIQSYDRAMTLQNMSSEAKRLAYTEVDQFLLEYGQFFDALFRKWRESLDFYNHYHWTPEDIKKIKAAGQQPYISPHMWRWMSSLIGEEQSTKTTWETAPKDPSSRPYCDLANGVLSAFSDINDWPAIDSDVFRDGAIGGIGVGMCSLDPMDPKANIVIDRCKPYEFMWDRAAKNGNLDGARMIVRGYWHSLEELVAKYPFWADVLRTYNPGTFYRDHQFLFRIQEPKVASPVSDIYVPVQMQSEMMTRVGKRIWLMEAYRRRVKDKVFRVTDANFMIDHDFDTLAQAGEFFMMLREAYHATAMAQTLTPPEDPMVLEPRQVSVMVTDQEIWCGDLMIDKQEIAGGQTPYEFFIPFFTDNEIHGFFEGEKSHERLRDRITIFFDMVAAAAKAKTTINLAKLPKDLRNNPQRIKQVLSRANEPLFIEDKSPDADVSRIVTHSQVPNYGPVVDQWLRFIDGGSNAYLGGQASAGLPDFSGQSGKGMVASRAASSMAEVPLMSAHERFERRMGEKVLYNSQFLDKRIQLSTVDRRGNTQFFRVIDYGIQSIPAARMKVQVTEVAASPSVRDRKLQGVLAILQNASEDLMTAVLPEILELSDIEVARVDRIVARMQQAQQAEAQQASQEHQLEIESLVMKWLDQRQHRANEQEKLRIMANPPIAASLQMRAMPGPGVVTEVVNQHGIHADVPGVIADTATQAIIDQNIEDLRQERFNAGQVDLQRQLSKIPQPISLNGAVRKPGAGRPPGSRPQTAKDASNRTKRRGKQQS